MCKSLGRFKKFSFQEQIIDYWMETRSNAIWTLQKFHQETLEEVNKTFS